MPRDRIVTEHVMFSLGGGEITIEELDRIIKTAQRGKATGPYEIPMEAFMELNRETTVVGPGTAD